VLALSACGGDDSDSGKDSGGNDGSGANGPRYPYPEGTVRAFVTSCAQNGSRSVCQCTIDRLQETLPFKDFDAGDRAIRAGRDLSPSTRRVIDEATESCRE
jgi:hypothetical protein